MARKQTTDPTTDLLMWGIKQLGKLLNALFINFQKKKIEKIIKEKQDKINNTLKEKLNQYNHILEKKFQQLAYKDDYGIVKTDKYEKELLYFINNIVDPEQQITDESKNDIIKKITDIMKENVDLNDVSFSNNINPYDFEKQCAQILNQNGWNAHATSKSSDQGVDVIAEKNGITVALQCKLYSKAVGNKAVQEVVAGKDFYKAQYTAVVTNNTYTTSARQLAQNCNVLLLSVNDLPNLENILNM